MQPVQHIGRHASRRHESEPGVDLVAFDATGIECWHLRHQGRSLQTGHPQRLELAALDLVDDGGHVEKPHADLAAHHRHNALRRALVGYMQHVRARHLAKQHARQVMAGAATTRRKREMTGFGLGGCHHVEHRVRCAVRRHDHHVGDAAHQIDRREVFQRVITRSLVKRLVEHQRALRGIGDGVAIGWGAGQFGHRDGPASARLVVHHHRLAERLGKFSAHQARHDVCRAASGQRHQELDRATRVGLGLHPHEGTQGKTQCQHRQELGVVRFHTEPFSIYPQQTIRPV